MKQLSSALACLLLSTSISAQIQITSADMPVIGDELVRSVDTIPAFGPGGSGPDQVWDFSSAVEDYIQTSSVVDPASTPSADQFGSSNLAITVDGLNFSYMTNTASELTVDGFSGDPLGDGTIMLDAPFDPTLTVHQFPRQYTSAFDDDFGFDVTVDGSDFGVYQARMREVGTVSDSTDGFGMIITPVGTYYCLRSRTTTIRTDSIWAQLIQILPFALIQSSVDTTVSYAWHAVETKLPVAEMTLDSAGNALDFTWSTIEPGSTAIPNAGPVAQDLLLFPQPTKDQVRISMGSAPFLSIAISDMRGEQVLMNARAANDAWLDLSGLPAGMYVVHATDGLDQRSTRPLILGH